MMRRILQWGILALLLGLLITPGPDTRHSVTSQGTANPCGQLKMLKPQYPVGDGERVLFALAERYGTAKATLSSCVRGPDGYTLEWQAPAFTGETGFAVPGPVAVDSLLTPTGSYSMTEAFGRADPGTALDYRTLTPYSWWSGSKGPGFNNFFSGDGTPRDEHLWEFMLAGDYEQAVVINFNRPPDADAQYGQTFAIFLHAGLSETWGCISTDLDTVIRVQHMAQPGDRIILGAESEIFDG